MTNPTKWPNAGVWLSQPSTVFVRYGDGKSKNELGNTQKCFYHSRYNGYLVVKGGVLWTFGISAIL